MLHLYGSSTCHLKGFMESSMKVMVLVLTGVVLILYCYGLKNRSQFHKLLLQGSMNVDGESVHISEILGQARFLIFFVFCVNLGIWLLCFVYLSHWLGAVGCTCSFVDFIMNYEVLSKLGKSPYEEASASRVMIGFYLVSILYLCCLCTLIFLVATQ